MTLPAEFPFEIARDPDCRDNDCQSIHLLDSNMVAFQGLPTERIVTPEGEVAGELTIEILLQAADGIRQMQADGRL